VRFFIDGVPAECLEHEERLLDRFGLKTCSVVPHLSGSGDADSSEAEFTPVGAAAAKFLHARLSGAEPMLVGMGKGRSLTAMANILPGLYRPDHRFVSVSGNLSANPYDVIHKLSERTGGEGYFLPVPYIAASGEEKTLFEAQKSVQELLSLARRADLYVVGIGSLGADAHVKQMGMVTEAEWSKLRARRGRRHHGQLPRRRRPTGRRRGQPQDAGTAAA